MSATNRAIVQQMIGAINARQLEQLEALVAPEAGLAELQRTLRLLYAVLGDFSISAEEIITANDKITVRMTLSGTNTGEFMGLPPTGRQVTFSAMTLIHCAAGQVIACWCGLDYLGLMRQLGLFHQLD